MLYCHLLGHVDHEIRYERFPIGGPLTQPLYIYHSCRNINPQRFGGHDLNPLGSRAVIGHMTIDNWTYKKPVL